MPAAERAKAGSRGVSTVIGMAIFLTIFALAASYTFIWSQQFADYGSAAKRQLEVQQQRSAESLLVEVIEEMQGNIYLDLTNPTDQVIVVTQVWSAHKCQEGEWGVPPFSKRRIDITISNPGDAFKVVTLRGNVFSAERQSSAGRWKVTWYNGTRPNDLMGQSYWDGLDVNLRWLGSASVRGFNATAKVTAMWGDAYIIIRKAPIINLTVKLDNTGYSTTDPGASFKVSNLDTASIHTLTIYLEPTALDVEVWVTFVNLDFAR